MNRRESRYLAVNVATKRRPSAYDFPCVAAMGKIKTAHGRVPIPDNPPQQCFQTVKKNGTEVSDRPSITRVRDKKTSKKVGNLANILYLYR